MNIKKMLYNGFWEDSSHSKLFGAGSFLFPLTKSMKTLFSDLSSVTPHN